MEKIKETIAANLVALRKERKYTQQELAAQLNYSDKAVSRWEHAETLPDIETLCKICEIYGVKFEYLLQREQPKKNNPYVVKKDTPKKILIILIAAFSVWIAAILAYVYIDMFVQRNAWTLFIWAIPVTSTICQFFHRFFFGDTIAKYIFFSVTQWTVILSVYLQLLRFNIWLLFIVGIPVQVVTVLMAILKISKK